MLKSTVLFFDPTFYIYSVRVSAQIQLFEVRHRFQTFSKDSSSSYADVFTWCIRPNQQLTLTCEILFIIEIFIAENEWFCTTQGHTLAKKLSKTHRLLALDDGQLHMFDFDAHLLADKLQK